MIAFARQAPAQAPQRDTGRLASVVTALVNAAPADALVAWFEALQFAGSAESARAIETPLDDALGRVLALDVEARQSNPPYPVAAMDGIAVRADEIEAPPTLAATGSFSWIDTGQPVLGDWDAVVPVEETASDPRGVIVQAPVRSGQHIRAAGEDMREGAVVAHAGTRLGPYELALAASCGHAAVWTRTRPRVAIIPTGDELRPAGSTLAPGETAESNGLLLSALARIAGAEPIILATERDEPAAIREAVRTAATECELLLVLSGSSCGKRDHTAAVLEGLGQIVVDGVALRPGHPVILAIVGSTPVIGVPGYPISAVQTFSRFAEPMLAHLSGTAAPARPTVRVQLASTVYGRQDIEIMIPVRLEWRGADSPLAFPLSRKGSSLRAFSGAGAVIHVPPGETLGAGSLIDAQPRPGDAAVHTSDQQGDRREHEAAAAAIR